SALCYESRPLRGENNSTVFRPGGADFRSTGRKPCVPHRTPALDSTHPHGYPFSVASQSRSILKGSKMAVDADLTNEFFQVRRHGDLAVIVPSPQIEHLPETLLQPGAQMVLAPLKEDPPNQIIVDLSGVNYFGSAFITFLLRCHLMAKNRGSE